MKTIKHKIRTSPLKIWMGKHKACRITIGKESGVKVMRCENHGECYIGRQR